MDRAEFRHRVVVATAIVIGMVALAMVLFQLASVALIAFAAVLVAVMLHAFGDLIQRWTGLGTRLSVGVAATLVLAVFVAVFWMGGSSIAAESEALSEGLQQSLRMLDERLSDSRSGRFILERLPSFDGDAQLLTRFGDASLLLMQSLTPLLLAAAVGIFLAINPGLYRTGVLRLLPPARRSRGAALLDRLDGTLRGWLLGQAISMLVLWLSTWLLLAVLGVPMAFTLGVLTGLLSFIPYLGPLIALVPIALVAFLEGPTTTIWTVVLYMVIQTVESNFITPLIFQRTVQLPPALTVMAQVMMGGLLGLGGIVLATPLLAVVLVLVRTLYVEDTLGDHGDDEADGAEEPSSGGAS